MSLGTQMHADDRRSTQIAPCATNPPCTETLTEAVPKKQNFGGVGDGLGPRDQPERCICGDPPFRSAGICVPQRHGAVAARGAGPRRTRRHGAFNAERPATSAETVDPDTRYRSCGMTGRAALVRDDGADCRSCVAGTEAPTTSRSRSPTSSRWRLRPTCCRAAEVVHRRSRTAPRRSGTARG